MSPEISKNSLEGFQYYLNCLSDDVDIPVNVKYLREIVSIALDSQCEEHVIYNGHGEIVEIINT